MAGLGLVHSLYRAHHAVVPATAWHLVFISNGNLSVMHQHSISKSKTIWVTLLVARIEPFGPIRRLILQLLNSAFATAFTHGSDGTTSVLLINRTDSLLFSFNATLYTCLSAPTSRK